MTLLRLASRRLMADMAAVRLKSNSKSEKGPKETLAAGRANKAATKAARKLPELIPMSSRPTEAYSEWMLWR